MTLDVTYTVSGTIKDASGSTVAGATVYVYNIIEKGDTVSTTTVTDGSYTFDISNICSIGDEILVYTQIPTGYMDGRSFTLFDTDSVNTFSLTEITDYGGTYRGLFYDGTYLYSAAEGNGLEIYTYSAETLTRVTDDTTTTNVRNVTSDGIYIYAACYTDGLYGYSFDGSNITYINKIDDDDTYYNIFVYNSYIYVSRGNSGISAYTFDGATFTHKATQDDGGIYYGVYADDNYIYTACGSDGLRIYSFNGTNFTLLNTQNDGGYYYDVYADENYIYTACGADGLRKYSFDGSNITLVASHDAGGTYYNVKKDDTFIYCCASGVGLVLYVFDGATLTVEDTQLDVPLTYSLYLYNKDIYVGCFDSGIAVYNINIVQPMNITVSEYPTMNFTSANYESRLRYCPIYDLDADITKNIDIINFRNNDVEAVDRDINKIPLKISGVEYATTPSDVPYLAYKFETIWNIMEHDEEITITDIDNCYNGVYIINSFEFNSIPKTANAYNWYISLEKVRDV